MKIYITTIHLDLTPTFRTYIEKNLSPVERLIKKYDPDGTVKLKLEIARTTKHHKHGDVFMAAANLDLPKNILRAEARADDPRKAVDLLKNILSGEVRKYRTKDLSSRRKT